MADRCASEGSIIQNSSNIEIPTQDNLNSDTTVNEISCIKADERFIDRKYQGMLIGKEERRLKLLIQIEVKQNLYKSKHTESGKPEDTSRG